jgi:transglutaminase-like putative cysteine protease
MAGLNPTFERAREKTVTRRPQQERTRPRLLMSWEDWLTLFAVSLVFLSLAGSFQSANLVRNMPAMIPTALGAMILGLFAARIQFSQPIIHVGGLALGVLVVLLAVQGYADGATMQDRIVDIRIRMEEWFAIVRAGDISNDNLPFVLLVHSLTFLAAYFGTWATYRWHTPWVAVVPAGLFLLINISLLRGQPSTAFVFYLFGALLLVARMHLQKRQTQWRRQGVEYPEFMSLSVAQLTVTLAAGLMIAAWLVPLGTQARLAESAVETAMRPVNSQTDFFVRMFHNLDASRSGNFHSYGDVLPIRGDVSLGSRELFQVRGLADSLTDEQLRLLRGASYDEYTGTGWRATDRDRLRIDGGSTAVTEEAAYQKREFRSLDFMVTSGESVVFFEGTAFGTNLDTSVEVPGVFSGDVEQVRSRRGLREGDSYSSVGTVSFASPDDLRAAGTEYPDWVVERYLQLPGELPERVVEHTAQIAGGAATPFDKAIVLEEYLRSFPYDLEVPAAPPDRGRLPALRPAAGLLRLPVQRHGSDAANAGRTRSRGSWLRARPERPRGARSGRLLYSAQRCLFLGRSLLP